MVRHGARDLLVAANRFINNVSASGRMAKLLLDETGDARPFQYEESREFQAHLTERLPRYQTLFQAASVQTGIDWRLLAAIGYQESKWNPIAVCVRAKQATDVRLGSLGGRIVLGGPPAVLSREPAGE